MTLNHAHNGGHHPKNTVRPGIGLVLAVFAMAAGHPSDADAAAPSLVGSSTKICQLTGDTDWSTNQPTAARTLSQFGLDAVDLGFPVDSGNGPLYFLFGDALPVTHGVSSVPPDDALGWTTRTATPDPTTCLGLQLATSAPQIFAHPTVTPAIQQGSFNVPSGGVFLNDTLNAFFWTDHCVFPGVLAPDPATPLTLPPPESLCAEIPANNSIGRSVLAQATPANPGAFQRPISPIHPVPQMPSGFVYVSATTEVFVNDDNFIRIIPPARGPWIPVFGAARYRASIPYLALAPAETFDDPWTWRFFAGRVGENPIWVSRAEWESGRAASGEWAPPLHAEIYQPTNIGDRCVGEHSVTWNRPLRAWLLLYNCGAGIEARTAPAPWGPWSAPIVLLSPTHDPGAYCTLIQQLGGCTGLRNYWDCPLPAGNPNCPAGTPWPGFFYAPFVMNRFTEDATPTGGNKQATIYWLVSTWNPYAVVVMQSTLELP